MKRFDKQENFDNELKKMSGFHLTEQESTESVQTIITEISKRNKREKVRFHISRATATLSTLIALIVVGWFLYKELGPQFNLAGHPSESNEMDGIELKLAIDKDIYSIDDEFIAKVTLTNHNNSTKEFYVPIPKEVKAGISAVMVQKKDAPLWKLLIPHNNQDLANIEGRSFYDFILVKLGANETVEQEFHWNKELFNQESKKNIVADSGEYTLSTFILLDKISDQQDYYEPEKQLITKLNFTITDKPINADIYSKGDCAESDFPCVNAITGHNAVKVLNGTSTLYKEDGRVVFGDTFPDDIEKNLKTLKVKKKDMITLDFLNQSPKKLNAFLLKKNERVKEIDLTQNAFQAPEKSGTYTYEIVGEYANGTVYHYLKIKVE